jgi:hypothetical protein
MPFARRFPFDIVKPQSSDVTLSEIQIVNMGETVEAVEEGWSK